MLFQCPVLAVDPTFSRQDREPLYHVRIKVSDHAHVSKNKKKLIFIVFLSFLWISLEIVQVKHFVALADFMTRIKDMNCDNRTYFGKFECPVKFCVTVDRKLHYNGEPTVVLEYT